MAKRLLRREHIVAASLVGSVVVVIGFASGLGMRPGTGGANAAPAPGGDEHPVATAPAPTTQQAPPTQSGGGGGGGGGARYAGGGGGVPIITTEPGLPPDTGHTMAPTTTSPATTASPGTTDPNAPCQPGLVPAALGSLLVTLGKATDALGLGAGPASAAVATATLLPELPEGTPLDQFIATCPTATTAPPTTTTTG